MAKEKTEPNIKLRKDATPVTVDGEVNIGMAQPVRLPSLAVQQKGWHTPDAQAIIRQFPDRYIPYQDKGGL